MLAQNWAFSRVPVWIQRLLDEIVGANRTLPVRTAALTAAGFTALAGGCMFLMRKLIIGVSRRIEYDLRDDLFRRLIGLPFGFFTSPTRYRGWRCFCRCCCGWTC